MQNNIREEGHELILKNNFTKTKLLIKEINNLFYAHNLPLFIATTNKDGIIECEATLPEEVNIDNIKTAATFNRFLKDCTEYSLTKSYEK